MKIPVLRTLRQQGLATSYEKTGLELKLKTGRDRGGKLSYQEEIGKLKVTPARKVWNACM